MPLLLLASRGHTESFSYSDPVSLIFTKFSHPSLLTLGEGYSRTYPSSAIHPWIYFNRGWIVATKGWAESISYYDSKSIGLVVLQSPRRMISMLFKDILCSGSRMKHVWLAFSNSICPIVSAFVFSHLQYKGCMANHLKALNHLSVALQRGGTPAPTRWSRLAHCVSQEEQ